MADAETIPAQTAKKRIFETVTLSSPIERGESTIEKLQLRKPTAGELRGLNISELVALEVTALATLLPRIVEPVLTRDEIDDLEVNDFTDIAGVIRGFFMTRGEQAMMEAMMEQHRPKS